MSSKSEHFVRVFFLEVKFFPFSKSCDAMVCDTQKKM